MQMAVTTPEIKNAVYREIFPGLRVFNDKASN
jgi:hypothetical protein